MKKKHEHYDVIFEGDGFEIMHLVNHLKYENIDFIVNNDFTDMLGIKQAGQILVNTSQKEKAKKIINKYSKKEKKKIPSNVGINKAKGKILSAKETDLHEVNNKYSTPKENKGTKFFLSLVFPFIFNDLVITVITGQKIGWAKMEESQNRIFAASIVLFFIYGLIYYVRKHRPIAKKYVLKIILYLTFLGTSLALHIYFFEKNIVILFIYAICALLQFIIIQDVDFDKLDPVLIDNQNSKQENKKKVKKAT